MEADAGRNGRARRPRRRGRDLAAASRTTPVAREARLAADSGGRAGPDGPRVLVFVHIGLVVALEATRVEGPGRHRIAGAITPPPTVRTPVRTRGRGRPARALTDTLGRFTLDEVASGPFSLSLTPPGAAEPPLVTEWVVL